MEIANIDQLGERQRNISWQEMRNKYATLSEVVDGHTVYKFYGNYQSDQIIEAPFYMSLIPINSFIPWHVHDYIEITIVIQGNLKMHFLGETITVRAGQAVLVDARCAHQNTPLIDPSVAMTIAIRPNILQKLLIEGMPTRGVLTRFLSHSMNHMDFAERYWQFVDIEQNILSGILTGLIGTYSKYEGLSNDLQQSLLQALLLLLMNQSHIFQTNNVHINKFHIRPLDLILYIDEQYRIVSLKNMANFFNYSPNYLSTKLIQTTGYSFQQLVQQKRLDVATELLKKTDISVEKVASNVGYSNPVYFYRLFKRVFGVTPKNYRKDNRS